MKLRVVLAGAAVLAFAAGAAQAAVNPHTFAARHHHVRTRANRSGRFSAPAAPIAYSKLDAYTKASPHARATQNWGLDNTGMAAGAAAGAGANASATAPTTATEPQAGMTQPSGGVTADQQGAAAPAPSTQAPNPPATAPDNATQPQAAPDTSMQPPAAPSTAQPQ